MGKRTEFERFVTDAVVVGGAAWLISTALKPESEESRIRKFVVARVRKVARILGIGAPPVVETNTVTAAACDGLQILYNHDWVVGVLGRYCRDGHCEDQVVLGVVAHELAHHGLKHAFNVHTRPHETELDADYIAGQVLAIAGTGSDHFESVLWTESPWATATHPAGFHRVEAVQRGYRSQLKPVYTLTT